jgi:hypothetical protein
VTEAEDARRSLEAEGFEVRLRRQDRHAELVARGEPGQASFFTQGREYWCLDLLRNGAVAWEELAVGETEDGALVDAWRRYTR